MRNSKPSGWKDGGEVWLNDRSRYGMRYRCKSCGREGAGYGFGIDSHNADCPVTAVQRAARDARIAAEQAKADDLRRQLAVLDWSAQSNAIVLRVAEILALLR